jgi:hypothetical protein
MKRALILFSVLVAACGAKDSTWQKAFVGTASDPALQESQDLELAGSVAGAFDLTVDGQGYSDIEQFYTAESARLPERVEEAGYSTEGLRVVFAAQVGLSDFWQGMTVYSNPIGPKGKASATAVRADGSFSFRIPEADQKAVFELRAVKRIAVELWSGEQLEHRFCYILSGRAGQATVSAPAAISVFDTQLTTYECSQSELPSGLAIPTVAPTANPSPTPVAP